ncbi:alpha-ketoglutarate-dependent dioxygenase AlkB [Streptomyces sp. NPDC047002]|uniref:alpha-ketoglutarate-dependent dioxygenase AlkB n=1 Tax=Streptomyces sp. NPDC047002 TaxID=3155475 RepID=UPI003451E0A7
MRYVDAAQGAGNGAGLDRGGVVHGVLYKCLCWHWRPYRYSRMAGDVNGARVVDFPGWLADLGREAVAAAYEGVQGAESYLPEAYAPDTALVNFYEGAAKMGMHQDKDEKSRAPVVSLSIGDRCVFRFGNAENRGRPYTDVELGSGDLFVFGGPARLAYHAVPKVYPGTADPGTGMRGGRLNLTLRETGLDGLDG